MQFAWLTVGVGWEGARRSALRLAAIAVVTCLGVVIVAAVFQRHFIYFPSRKLEALPSDVGLRFERVTLRTADGVQLSAWYVPRQGATVTFLLCHGNAGNISHRVPKMHILHELGFNVLALDYRGYGQSDGQPDEQGLYHDARAAWDYLTQAKGEESRRIVLFGESLGGAVAIDLATRVMPLALVVESTFTSLADVGKKHYPLLPVRWVIGDQYRSIDKIGAVKCPVLILHGEEDELVPVAMAQALLAAAPEPKKLILTPGGHNEAGFSYSPEHAVQVQQFVASALTGP